MAKEKVFENETKPDEPIVTSVGLFNAANLLATLDQIDLPNLARISQISTATNWSDNTNSGTWVNSQTLELTTRSAIGVLIIISGQARHDTAGNAGGLRLMVQDTNNTNLLGPLAQTVFHSSNANERSPYTLVGWHNQPSDRTYRYRLQIVAADPGTVTVSSETIDGSAYGNNFMAIELRK